MMEDFLKDYEAVKLRVEVLEKEEEGWKDKKSSGSWNCWME